VVCHLIDNSAVPGDERLSSFAVRYHGIGTLSSWLGAMLGTVVVLAGCSSDSGGTASADSPRSTPSPSVAIGASGSTSPAPRPLASSAHPPLAGFGEVHDIGSVVGIAGDVLRLDRKAYVRCTPQPADADPCLDGYRINDVETGTREYVVTPTARVTLSVQPEEYETGDLADLREFVTTHPSNLMILRLDAMGRVTAVGQPWLP
jgi:hypothetical protein